VIELKTNRTPVSIRDTASILIVAIAALTLIIMAVALVLSAPFGQTVNIFMTSLVVIIIIRVLIVE